jgi:hypothetical protein
MSNSHTPITVDEWSRIFRQAMPQLTAGDLRILGVVGTIGPALSSRINAAANGVMGDLPDRDWKRLTKLSDLGLIVLNARGLWQVTTEA